VHSKPPGVHKYVYIHAHVYFTSTFNRVKQTTRCVYMYMYMNIYVLQQPSIMHSKRLGVYMSIYTCTYMFCNYLQSCTANHQVYIYVYIHANICITTIYVYMYIYMHIHELQLPSVMHSKRSGVYIMYIYVHMYILQLPSVEHSKPPGVYTCIYTCTYIFPYIYIYICTCV